MTPVFLVEPAAPLDAERLGHRDVHALDILARPDGLEERVREPEIQNVLNGLLAQIVIDAEDGLFREGAMERGVQRPCRLEVASERLLDDDARAGGAAGAREVLDDQGNALGGIAR